MISRLLALIVAPVLLFVVGCGGSDASKPTTAQGALDSRFTPEVKRNFLSTCVGGEITEAACTAQYECFARELGWDDFKKVDSAGLDALDERITNVLVACTKEAITAQ